MKYFGYGSNLWLEQMAFRCPEHRVLGLGRLQGYRWFISSRGYANIAVSADDFVLGLVFEISQSDEKSLDKYEGVHRGLYRKENLPVLIGNESLDCLVYVDPVEEEGRPKAEYIARINKGIRDAKLPLEYVERCIRKYVPASAEAD